MRRRIDASRRFSNSIRERVDLGAHALFIARGFNSPESPTVTAAPHIALRALRPRLRRSFVLDDFDFISPPTNATRAASLRLNLVNVFFDFLSSFAFRFSFVTSTGPATPILCAKKNCGAPRSNAGLMDNSCGVSCGAAHSRRRSPVYSEPVLKKAVTTTTEGRARRGPIRPPRVGGRVRRRRRLATSNKGSPPPQSPRTHDHLSFGRRSRRRQRSRRASRRRRRRRRPQRVF